MFPCNLSPFCVKIWRSFLLASRLIRYMLSMSVFWRLFILLILPIFSNLCGKMSFCLFYIRDRNRIHSHFRYSFWLWSQTGSYFQFKRLFDQNFQSNWFLLGSMCQPYTPIQFEIWRKWDSRFRFLMMHLFCHSWPCKHPHFSLTSKHLSSLVDLQWTAHYSWTQCFLIVRLACMTGKWSAYTLI